MKRIILPIAAMALSCMAYAQSDSLRTVVNVHNEYNPVHIKVSKKSFVPTAAAGADGSHRAPEIEFMSDAMPYSGFVSERDAREITKEPARRYGGYARAGYGIGNSLDLRAAYNGDMTSRDNVRLYASMDGYKTGIDRFQGGSKWNSRMYSTAASLDYTHAFKGILLGAGADFGNRVFNYQSKEIAPGAAAAQNSMNYGVYIDGKSTLKGAFDYRFNAAYRDNTRKYAIGSSKGIGERRASAGIAAWYGIGDTELEEVGIAVNFDAFLYNSTLRNAVSAYRNYCSIDVDPYLDFAFGGWDVRLGTRMNLVTANAPLFAISPDIKISKGLGKGFAFYAVATGGRTNNTLAMLESITPYWNLDVERSSRLRPTYRIVDASAGVTFASGAFHAALAAGYAYTKDDVLQHYSKEPVMPYELIYSSLSQCNTNNVNVSLRAGYDYGGWLRIAGDCRYGFWECGNRSLLMMRPEVTCNIAAEVKPFRDFTLNVDYCLELYTKAAGGNRASSKNDLSARINYSIFPWLGVYVEGSNLLNDSYLEYAGYETRGARGLLGVSARF